MDCCVCRQPIVPRRGHRGEDVVLHAYGDDGRVNFCSEKCLGEWESRQPAPPPATCDVCGKSIPEISRWWYKGLYFGRGERKLVCSSACFEKAVRGVVHEGLSQDADDYRDPCTACGRPGAVKSYLQVSNFRIFLCSLDHARAAAEKVVGA